MSAEDQWDVPVPESQNEPIDSLLADSEIPSHYDKFYNQYSDDPASNTISVANAKRFLQTTGLDDLQIEHIERLVSLSDLETVSRGTWNVLLALVGLAQKGESDISLNAVDASRFDLPLVTSDILGSSGLLSPTDGGTGALGSLGTGWSDMVDALSPNEDDGEHIGGISNGAANWTRDEYASFNPVSKPCISVKLVPEREGMFLFRHVVYFLEGTLPGVTGDSFKVVRRYSDFLWLLECLVKRYPFRMLPVLPPKRLTVDGRYLSSDQSFLERRRRGLERFVNTLVRHPLLRQDRLVVMFLTVDTELAVWRKQSQLQVEEEFTQRVISQEFKERWDDAKSMALWKEVRNGAMEALEAVIQLCQLFDRICKRDEAMSQDLARVAQSLSHIDKSFGTAIAPLDTSGDLGIIREGIRSAATYASNAKELMFDKYRSIEIGTVEDAKLLRESLTSIVEMFSRYEKYGGNNIPYLRRQIEANKARLQQAQSKPDVRPQELSRIKNLIARDENSIDFQQNRTWLVKECISEELTLAQAVQYQVSFLLRNWSMDAVKYGELISENWQGLNNAVGELPLP